MQSLRNSLSRIGKSSPFSLTGDLQTRPKRLSEVLRIMNLPKPDIHTLQYRRFHDFTEENAQGLAFGGGDTWFLSSEWNFFKYRIQGSNLYQPERVERIRKVHLRDLLRPTTLNENEYDHIGDIDVLDGLLLAPIRSTTGGHLLLALSSDLELVGYMPLAPGTGESWCSVNPWEKILYLPRIGDNYSLDVYEPAGLLGLFVERSSWGRSVPTARVANKTFRFFKNGVREPVPSIQGIAFSENGRLYIARYNGDGPWENFIQIYDALTGEQLAASPEYNFPGTYDEIEGLSVHPSGVLYVAVADNDILLGFDDEFELFAFCYSDRNFPM